MLMPDDLLVEMLKKILPKEELAQFAEYIKRVENENALDIMKFDENFWHYTPGIPGMVFKGAVEIPDAIIKKRCEQAFTAQEQTKYKMLATILKSCRKIYKIIDPEIFNKIKELAKKDPELQEEIEKTMDKKEAAKTAEEFWKQEDYFRAYRIYKWAGLLDKEILAKILEKLKATNLGGYIIVCYAEHQKIDPKEGLEIAEKLEKEERYGAALTAYYLIDDKQKIKELIEKLKKKNEE